MSIFKSLFGSNKEEKERLQKEEEERLQKEKREKERLQKEKREKERLQKEEEERLQKEKKEKERLRKVKQIQNEEKQKEEKRIRKEKFFNEKNETLKRLDKDSNGIIDIVEINDDLLNLVKKHQQKINNIDNISVQDFVKLSNYLKTKRDNIQKFFVLTRRVKNEKQLNSRLQTLNKQIYSYQILLLHSLKMITSIVEDDLIVCFETYEKFDKLNIFNSNYENDISGKLNDLNDNIEKVNVNLSKIESGMNGLLKSIESMESKLVSQLDNLSFVIDESFYGLEKSLTTELSSINSSIQTNNLLTGIQTYQMYKINKNTKSLRE